MRHHCFFAHRAGIIVIHKFIRMFNRIDIHIDIKAVPNISVSGPSRELVIFFKVFDIPDASPGNAGAVGVPGVGAVMRPLRGCPLVDLKILLPDNC
jgi:hypothetical protein